MIHLAYWQAAAWAYAIATATYFGFEGWGVIQEWGRLDKVWQRVAYPLLLLAWLPMLAIAVPIVDALKRARLRKALKNDSEPLDQADLEG